MSVRRKSAPVGGWYWLDPDRRFEKPQLNGGSIHVCPGSNANCQYIRYCYGARLPDSMRDWVRNDLAGKGAAARMMIRVAAPAVLVLAPFWLIPTSLDVHLSMTLPILIPFVYFSHALNKVWRRHMLAVHNLDPDLVDELARKRDAHIHQAYIERYGPRPESTPPQRPPQSPGIGA